MNDKPSYFNHGSAVAHSSRAGAVRNDFSAGVAEASDAGALRETMEFCRRADTVIHKSYGRMALFTLPMLALHLWLNTAPRSTVDNKTSSPATKSFLVRWKFLPTPVGTCPECAVVHPEGEPHNPQSLQYQYWFFAHNGRWPTWLDAMAHCNDETKARWMEALTAEGVDVPGKN